MVLIGRMKGGAPVVRHRSSGLGGYNLTLRRRNDLLIIISFYRQQTERLILFQALQLRTSITSAM
jgi:hypothetical protein